MQESPTQKDVPRVSLPDFDDFFFGLINYSFDVIVIYFFYFLGIGKVVVVTSGSTISKKLNRCQLFI